MSGGPCGTREEGGGGGRAHRGVLDRARETGGDDVGAACERARSGQPTRREGGKRGREATHARARRGPTGGTASGARSTGPAAPRERSVRSDEDELEERERERERAHQEHAAPLALRRPREAERTRQDRHDRRRRVALRALARRQASAPFRGETAGRKGRARAPRTRAGQRPRPPSRPSPRTGPSACRPRARPR